MIRTALRRRAVACRTNGIVAVNITVTERKLSIISHVVLILCPSPLRHSGIILPTLQQYLKHKTKENLFKPVAFLPALSTPPPIWFTSSSCRKQTEYLDRSIQSPPSKIDRRAYGNAHASQCKSSIIIVVESYLCSSKPRC